MTDQIIIYQSPDGTTGIEVHLEAETVWLTQDQMAELFGKERSVITKHLRNVFREGELDEAAVRAKYAHTAKEANRKPPWTTTGIRRIAFISATYSGTYRPGCADTLRPPIPEQTAALKGSVAISPGSEVYEGIFSKGI